jgi:putative sigma-54 modulation protein
MIIDTRASGFDLAGAFRRHLERRVRAVFNSSTPDVQAVTISLSDVNGPRGGLDLRCAVTVDLPAGGHARAEATDSDIVVALGRALNLAKRSMRRHRQRGHRTRMQAPEQG